MEQSLIDYLTNASWQIPLLAGGAWVFIRAGKFGPRTQHCIWLVVLALAVGLPLRGVRAGVPAMASTACNNCGADATGIHERKALPPAAIVTQFIVGGPRLATEFFIVPRPTLRLSPVATNWLVGIYFAVFFFGLYQILTSWRHARHLAMDSDPAVLPPQWDALFQDSGRRIGAKLPQLRTSADVRSPVVIGVMHPVLLLPENFGGNSHDEVQAAFFHELAHVRRHDYLSNLLCRLAALPVAWHPLTHGVQQRIRRTREMVCDDIAARAMQSEIAYAKCLLAMAGRTLDQPDFADAAQAIGLFGDNVLEERIMRLMQEKHNMAMQPKLARIAGGAIAMILAIAIAASFHVTPTLAQTSGPTAAVPTPPAAPASAPDAAAAPLPPAPPKSDISSAPAPPAPPVPPGPDMAIPPQPPAPPASDAAIPPVAPIPPVEPAPPQSNPPTRKSKVGGHHPQKVRDKSFVIDSNGKSFVVDVNGAHVLSVEQQAQLQKEMAAMDAQIAKASRQFNSLEFKQQMAQIAKQQADLKHLDLTQMQHEIDAATAKINKPEFKRQMAALQRQMESGAMQRSMEEASKQIEQAEKRQNDFQKLDMAKMQQQIDAAAAKINSPEFKQRMANLQKQIESGAMQRNMEKASQQLKAAEDRMRQEQTK
jgi:beta-lactamase regulating signal transducer with metallopeptidase domain